MAADINMYGLKYQFSRTSTNGADILITIHKKWYEGEVITRALGRAPVIKRENKDHIYGTSCELYLECKVDGEFAEMYTSDPMEYRVAVYKDEALLFIGFVSPELYSEPDIAPPYDVQIIATDGLGELKNFDFGKRGTASILSHINYLMSKSGIGVPINVVSDLRFANSSGVEVAAKEILSIKVNLDHEANNSCYEALQSLLASLNANITQLNGRYLIFRETDFIAMASDSGVEAFDVNGGSLVLPVAKFGSMQTCQWWPVGQLSTVIEPAKNHISLKSSDHYKSNVLDFEDWSLIGASYDEKEAAYLLPNKNSAITQTITFGDQEVGYRLGLRVRARNVASGSSDKEQNLGLKVEMEGRAKAFSIDLGPNFWLIKSEGGNAGTPLGYIWRSSGESSIEEELRVPSAADSAADAQTIDIVLPFIEEGSNNYDTYTYAKAIKINIFNPLGEHGIYVYDVSLVKYEQIKGYQADVLINNSAREAGADVEFTLSSGIYAPAAADIFMTGLPLQPSGHDIITQWKTGDDQMREYLAAMSFDYSRAVALPKMKYTGVLNVPGSEPLLPTLFLRDGTYYFPKTYTYDLYADELNVELISISAADVSLSSVVISQTSEASATMGATTGSVGGGGIVSMPRDKEMSDTSDNAVENKVIKAYIDNLWHLDENGNLVTDKQVLIKNNLIIDGDTSSGGEGEDTPIGGISGVKVNGVTYYDDNGDGVIDLGTISGGGGTADLSNYYTKSQSDARYLAQSGGTINGTITFSSSNPAMILNRASSTPYMEFGASSSLGYGDLGVNANGDAVFWSLVSGNSASNAWHPLIHSGNIGSYAMKWMGGANTGADVNSFSFVAGAYGVASASNSPTSTGYGAVLNIPYRVGYRNAPDYMGQIYIPNGDDTDRSIFYRTSLANSWNPWRRIVSEDDNGNVTLYGTHLFANKYIFMNDGGEGIYLSTDAISWHNAGNGWVKDLLVFNSSGNVGIGTASPSYKLDVAGTGRFTGAVTMSSTLSVKAIRIASTDAIAHFSFSRVGFNYIAIPKGGTLAFAHDNLSQAGSTLYMSEGQVNIKGNLVVSGDVASA